MKIVIIDDRKERKKQHLTDDEIERLNTLCEIRENMPLHQDFEEYSLLAIHESLLKESNLYNEIVEYTKRKRKYLILFSGGITQNGIYDSGAIMKINSADFYLKITSFLTHYSKEAMEYPLLRFLYGDEWRVPLLLRYKNLLWKYGVKESSQMELTKSDESVEYEIREVLMPNSDSISLEWIENELDKTRREV